MDAHTAMSAYVHVLEAEIAELREENARLRNGRSCLLRVNMTHGRPGGDCIYLGEDTLPGQERFLTQHVEYCDVTVVRGDIYVREIGSYGTSQPVLHICTEPGRETCYAAKFRMYVDYESGLAVAEAIRARKN